MASRDLIQQILDCLDVHIALLSGEGTIRYVNRGWEDFARDNGDSGLRTTGTGVNYLDVCRQAVQDDPSVEPILEGIQDVLAGRRQRFATEYPCHSPDKKRWFLMSARPIGLDGGGAVVAHHDITQRKLAQEAAELTNLELEGRVAEQTASLREAYENLAAALAEVERLKDQLQAENVALRGALELEQDFPEMIGHSDALKYVLFRIGQVAPTDAPVFITGETGTGKELVARAIHRLSPRRDGLFVQVNCASLPPQLVESELFGHEKGAYTGAHHMQVGRFELACGGTLFLDEIGELPLELQPKLLRVLQDGEFERVGSSRTRKVDVRVVTATNRNIESEVEKGRFREDLYYRLNVFPITVPPLRKRIEDLPELLDHFVAIYNKRLGKSVERISSETLESLKTYDWPGNIRELENLVHRAMILSHGPNLLLELPVGARSISGRGGTLQDVERNHILQTLQETGWRIEGKRGAAERLGLNPATLRSRMKKLGIKRPG